MSSSTTNLGMTLPADGERLSLGVLNQNWGKVDEFAGDMRNKNEGAFSTINALTGILDAALAEMPSSGVKAFQINATSTVGHFGAATYLCTLYKSGTSTTYASATFRRVDSPIVIDGARNANGWSFNSLNSQLGESKIYRISKTVTIPAGNTTTPGELEVDFASDIGNSSIWAVMCSLNSSVLPYVNNAGTVKTWVKLLSGSPSTKILIYNTDSAWTNYTLYTVLICRA